MSKRKGQDEYRDPQISDSGLIAFAVVLTFLALGILALAR